MTAPARPRKRASPVVRAIRRSSWHDGGIGGVRDARRSRGRRRHGIREDQQDLVASSGRYASPAPRTQDRRRKARRLWRVPRPPRACPAGQATCRALPASAAGPRQRRAQVREALSKSAALIGAPSVNGASADRRVARLAEAEVDVACRRSAAGGRAGPSPRGARCRRRRRPAGARSGSPRDRRRRRRTCSAVAAGVGAIPVLRRIISDGVTFFCWLTPVKPVRNAVTRSCRGRFAGARFGMLVPSVAFTASRNSTSSSAGSVGIRHVGRRTAPSWRGSLALKRSLSGRPITTSLTSGVREPRDLHQRPAGFAAAVVRRDALSTRVSRKLAVVQPPITPLPRADQAATSAARARAS